MKLKVGDRVVEDDGITILVYEIVWVDGKKAGGRTEFEGHDYYTTYLADYTNRKDIRKPNQSPADLTRRYLPKKMDK